MPLVLGVGCEGRDAHSALPLPARCRDATTALVVSLGHSVPGVREAPVLLWDQQRTAATGRLLLCAWPRPAGPSQNPCWIPSLPEHVGEPSQRDGGLPRKQVGTSHFQGAHPTWSLDKPCLTEQAGSGPDYARRVA